MSDHPAPRLEDDLELAFMLADAEMEEFILAYGRDPSLFRITVTWRKLTVLRQRRATALKAWKRSVPPSK